MRIPTFCHERPRRTRSSARDGRHGQSQVTTGVIRRDDCHCSAWLVTSVASLSRRPPASTRPSSKSPRFSYSSQKYRVELS